MDIIYYFSIYHINKILNKIKRGDKKCQLL